jgi:S1-C subfamily serine protease
MEVIFMSIDRFYTDCVVAIGTKTPEGRKEWRGSGFFYAYPHISLKDNLTVFIVTNRHVIDGLDEIIIKFNPNKQGESNEITYSIPDNLRFICPSEKVDIAVINVTQLINENLNIKYLKKDMGINVENITNSNIGEGDSIYVVGFPIGIVNDQQNATLVRNGSIAQIHNLINGNNNEFIIDASVFPGNSGGPVFLKPEPIVGIGHSYAEPKLIGIVHSYYTYRDKAVSPQTLQPRVLFEENSGLGAVYPVDTIEKSIKKYYEDVTKIGRKIIHNIEIMDQITDLEVYITAEVENLKKNN